MTKSIDISAIPSLPGRWYSRREIPDQLLRDLTRSPLVTLEPTFWVPADHLVHNGLPISLREGQVLALAANGLSEPESGKLLYVAASTVKTHRKKAFDKLSARNITQAVAEAISRGLIIEADRPKVP